MVRWKYTKEEIEFIRNHVKGRTTKDLVDLVNRELGTEFTVSKMRAFMQNHKLKNGMPKGNPPGFSKIYPEHVKKFITENYIGIGPKNMAELLNNTFGTNYTHMQLKSYYSRYKINSGLTGYYEKGDKPWNKGKKGFMGPNKTSFKKGNVPANYKPVGSERLDSKDGYILIKVQDHGSWPERWRHKHVVLWERENGPVPKGHVILFGDGNKQNLSLDNLILVSRAQLARLNQYDLIQSHVDLTKTALNVVDLRIKIAERMGKL